MRNVQKILVEIMKGGSQLPYLGIDARITLKWIVKELDIRIWNGKVVLVLSY
jgi:hypothetical protein